MKSLNRRFVPSGLPTLVVTENQKLLTGRLKYALNVRVRLTTIKGGAKVHQSHIQNSDLPVSSKKYYHLTNDNVIIVIEYELAYMSVCISTINSKNF